MLEEHRVEAGITEIQAETGGNHPQHGRQPAGSKQGGRHEQHQSAESKRHHIPEERLPVVYHPNHAGDYCQYQYGDADLRDRQDADIVFIAHLLPQLHREVVAQVTIDRQCRVDQR